MLLCSAFIFESTALLIKLVLPALFLIFLIKERAILEALLIFSKWIAAKLVFSMKQGSDKIMFCSDKVSSSLLNSPFLRSSSK